MRTNKDKFEHYKSLVDEVVSNFISQYFAFNEMPECIYSVHPKGMTEQKVTRASYQHEWAYWNDSKRLTSKDVDAIMEYQKAFVPTQEKLLINYEYQLGGGMARGAYKVSALMENSDKKHLFTDRAEAEKKLADNLAIYGDREGYKPCSYCRKQHPENEMHKAKMIGQSRDGFGRAYVKTTEEEFCSPTCASYRQMSMEG